MTHPPYFFVAPYTVFIDKAICFVRKSEAEVGILHLAAYIFGAIEFFNSSLMVS